VSQKDCANLFFGRTLSNFDRLWTFLAQKQLREQAFLEYTHLPPHLIYVSALPC